MSETKIEVGQVWTWQGGGSLGLSLTVDALHGDGRVTYTARASSGAPAGSATVSAGLWQSWSGDGKYTCAASVAKVNPPAEPSQDWTKTKALLVPPKPKHSCIRCGGPAYVGLLSVTCERVGGCKTEDERHPPIQRVHLRGGREIGYVCSEPIGVYSLPECHPTREGAIALWREKALAAERGR